MIDNRPSIFRRLYDFFKEYTEQELYFPRDYCTKQSLDSNMYAITRAGCELEDRVAELEALVTKLTERIKALEEGN